MRNYSWSLAYVTAVLEMDPETVIQRICEAERAIFVRSQEVRLEFHEIEAMGNAAMALQSCERVVLQPSIGSPARSSKHPTRFSAY